MHTNRLFLSFDGWFWEGSALEVPGGASQHWSPRSPPAPHQLTATIAPPRNNPTGSTLPAGNTHHDAVMDKPSPVPGRPQVGILLSAGHLDAPDGFPGLIELCVDGINSRMMGGHSIAQVRGDPVFLEAEHSFRSVFNSPLSLMRTTAARADSLGTLCEMGSSECCQNLSTHVAKVFIHQPGRSAPQQLLNSHGSLGL